MSGPNNTASLISLRSQPWQSTPHPKLQASRQRVASERAPCFILLPSGCGHHHIMHVTCHVHACKVRFIRSSCQPVTQGSTRREEFAYVHLDLANAASPGIIVSSRSRSRPAGAPLLSRPSVAALAILIIGVGTPRLQKFNRFQPYPPRPHLDFGAYLSHVLVTKIPSGCPAGTVSSNKSS